MRRAAKVLLFLAAVALPGLVLYHCVVVAPGDLRSSLPPCRGSDDDAAADLVST